MHRSISIGTALLLVQHITSFTCSHPRSSRRHRIKLRSAQDNQQVKAAASPSRRQFLAVATITTLSTASLTQPTRSNAAQEEAVDLSNLTFGRGSWGSSSTTTTSTRSSTVQVPATFTTYLTRFLIRYEPPITLWWSETRESYSLLNPDERIKRECRDLGRMACSIEKGLIGFLGGGNGESTMNDSGIRHQYGLLLEMLLDKYKDKDGAVRQIGLLFAMLPSEYQPVDTLQSQLLGKSLSESRENNLESEQDLLLLPNTYKAIYSSTMKTYGISPELQLIENYEGDIRTTIFGPLSNQPLSRQKPNLGIDYYSLLGISGGVGCAMTHSLVIPLDVVKTRMQTNPGEYNGIFSGAITISQSEGISSLLLGTQATIAGYLWYGITVYPSYTYLKNTIGSSLPSAFAVVHVNDVALVAGAIASVIASFGLAPIEAARIRVVTDPAVYKPLGLLGTLAVIADEDATMGWLNLYAGLPSLMTRQVIFGSVKFMAFERVSEAILLTWPMLREGAISSLGVSLVAGGISGALSSAVSQPADSVLTYVTKQSAGNLGVVDGARMMIKEDGFGSLFRGLGSRCVWAGCIIAGQFLLYDVFRGIFAITGDDLNQVFEVVLLPMR